MRKHCEANEIVTQAHVLMKEVARNIDQVKRNREQLSRVKELSGILDGWLGPGKLSYNSNKACCFNTNLFLFAELTVLGELKLEGLLMENNKPRVVLLFQTMLIVTKKKEDNRLQFKTYIHVSRVGCGVLLVKILYGIITGQSSHADRTPSWRTDQLQCDSVQRSTSNSNQADGSYSRSKTPMGPAHQTGDARTIRHSQSRQGAGLQTGRRRR